MLEVKWGLSATGQGHINNNLRGLFYDIYAKDEVNSILDEFKDNLIDFLSEHRTNNEIYEFGLQQDLLPKYINPIMETLRDDLDIIYYKKQKSIRKDSFLLGYNYYRKNDIRYKVKIK